MMDPCEKGSESEDQISSKSSSSPDQKKACADCGTTKTPLWRGGPAGPKSLCNACGIRSRKKKRDILGLNKGSGGGNDRKSRKVNGNHGHQNNNQKLGDGLKQRLMALGRDVMMRRSTVEKQVRKKLGEEEQAAVMLMALSYGSVYA